MHDTAIHHEIVYASVFVQFRTPTLTGPVPSHSIFGATQVSVERVRCQPARSRLTVCLATGGGVGGGEAEHGRREKCVTIRKADGCRVRHVGRCGQIENERAVVWMESPSFCVCFTKRE